ATVLHGLTVEDSRHVFAAIRLANPGGLGQAPEQDVRNEPTLPLRAVMALAADRDLIARQYANCFRDVFEIGVPAIQDSLECGGLKPLWILHTPTIQSCAKPPRSQVGRTSTTPAAGPWERLEESIIRCHLRFLAALGDSHITRRCGLEIADEARR